MANVAVDEDAVFGRVACRGADAVLVVNVLEVTLSVDGTFPDDGRSKQGCLGVH